MYSPIFPPAIGGPSTQCFHLCKALVKYGETPIVVTYGPSFDLKFENGFKVHTFKAQYFSPLIDKVLRWIIFPIYISYILKKEKIDILHCHSVSILSFMAALIAKIFGIPRIVKFAGDWVWETLSTHRLQAKDFEEIYRKSFAARFMTEFEKMGLELFDIIWVVSEFRKSNIQSLLGTTEKVRVINNCLLLERGGPHVHTESDPITVVSANRFIPHKRLPFMVEVFALANVPDSKLVLIGGGDQKEVVSVEEAILKFKVQGRVKLLGIISSEEVYKQFGQASMYLATTLEEGFPNVYIEAMHYGLPVITSDAGGSRELVIDQKSGFVIDPYDKEAFIDRIKELSNNKNLLNQMSHEAFERSKVFNLEHKITEFISMYQSLLKVN